MITVFNGETITSTAMEDEVLFLEKNDGGRTVPAGRNNFQFELLTGSVQVAVGKAVDTSKATTRSSAGSKWNMTINNQGYPDTTGPGEGNASNLRIVGSGTVAVSW